MADPPKYMASLKAGNRSYCTTKKPATVSTSTLVTKQSRTAMVQSVLEETATRPIDIQPRENYPKPKAGCERTSLLFGSGPKNSRMVSKGVAFSTSASFTSWDNQEHSAFICDEELSIAGSAEQIFELAEAPAEPKAPTFVMSLLEGSNNRPQRLHGKQGLMEPGLPKILEDSEEG